VPSKGIVLQKKAINWKVDNTHHFGDCDKVDDETQRQQCFFQYDGTDTR
jgi:hypothetical protein